MNDEIEIDLRKVILKIISGWKWILGAALIAGLAAFGLSSSAPIKFKSQAIVAITKARYIANFDPRYTTLDSSTTNKSYLDLANSDEIIQELVNGLNDPRKNGIKLDDFRKTVAIASLGSEPGIIKLNITLTDPNQAADLANMWADLFVKRANLVYSGDDPSQLVFFQKQLADASQEYDLAKQALLDFQKLNETVPLKNQLNSLVAAQVEGLQKQRAIRNSQEDARSLLNQIENLPPDAKISETDELNWTVLRVRFYTIDLTSNIGSSPTSNTNSSPVQLQIPNANNGEPVLVSTRREEIQNWISSLDAQYQATQDSLKGIEDQVTNLQGQIQNFENQAKYLTQKRDLASETFETLTRKTNEVGISTQQQNGDVRIAAKAILPNQEVSDSPVKTTAIGVVIGAILGGMVFLFMDWWKAK